jgi:hypothetical protein
MLLIREAVLTSESPGQNRPASPPATRFCGLSKSVRTLATKSCHDPLEDKLVSERDVHEMAKRSIGELQLANTPSGGLVMRR